MSKYTITIKNLINNKFDFKMTDYPIFDENYRETLNTKILNHYYMNEIGFETAPLFRFYLNVKLNEIMPYYNELYKYQLKLLKIDFGSNMNYKETFTQNVSNQSTSNSNSNSTSSSKGKSLFQDTPQGELKTQNIDTLQYATNLNADSSDTTSNITDASNVNGTSTQDYVKNVIGSNGTKYPLEVLEDLKNKFINIDMQIIEELNELFMGLY